MQGRHNWTFWQAYRALALGFGRVLAFVGLTFGTGLGIGYLLTEHSVTHAVAALAGVVCVAIGLAAWHMSRDDRR
jgi:hypothetical protein